MARGGGGDGHRTDLVNSQGLAYAATTDAVGVPSAARGSLTRVPLLFRLDQRTRGGGRERTLRRLRFLLIGSTCLTARGMLAAGGCVVAVDCTIRVGLCHVRPVRRQAGRLSAAGARADQAARGLHRRGERARDAAAAAPGWEETVRNVTRSPRRPCSRMPSTPVHLQELAFATPSVVPAPGWILEQPRSILPSSKPSKIELTEYMGNSFFQEHFRDAAGWTSPRTRPLFGACPASVPH